MYRWLPLFVAAISLSLACECIHTAGDVYTNTKLSPDVYRANVVSYGGQGNRTKIWKALVQSTFKGTLAPNTWFILAAPDTNAACGMTFSGNLGYDFLITGTFQLSDNRVFVTSCGANKLWTEVTQPEEEFLNNQYNPSTKGCATGHSVSCNPSPCSKSNCSIAGATCDDNYCNGCNAWWWVDEYNRVCF